MTERLTITLSDELAAQARAAAERSGSSVSGWLADAVAAHLRRDALGELLAELERLHGPVSPEGMASARQLLGIDDVPSVDSTRVA